jgi:adenosine deaminase
MEVPMPLEPWDPVPAGAAIAALPKADLHLHQEVKARLDRIAAARQGRPPYDWRGAARRLPAVPPGMARLDAIYAPEDDLDLTGAPDDAANFVARVAETLREGAADGAVLVEIRFGAGQIETRPDFMALFRAAERQAQAQYPRLRAEAIGYLGVAADPAVLASGERQLAACVRAAPAGLGGVDFRVDPYDTAADPALWAIAHDWAAQAADAGLGVTVHAGEFSQANLAAALRTPGLRRLGHAVHAAHDPRLLERLAQSGATVECCLTSNVLLGAVASYADHPIRRFLAAGIPVTLNTDLPLHLATTIGREYAIAAALGFAPAELLEMTRAAARAAFMAPARRAALLAELAAPAP